LNFRLLLAAACTVSLAACASQRDHFYQLTVLPEGARTVAQTPTVHVVLGVTVPSLVDRVEMVVSNTANGLLVLDHERWGGGFADQVSQTLARDIEKRRGDVLVGDRSFDQKTVAPVTMRVDIVRMSARPGGIASIEAHWRIVDESVARDEIGSQVFEAPVADTGYAAVAQAYSDTLNGLAEKLVAGLRPH
jgi:uncharacterized lipoprotein YmbA